MIGGMKLTASSMRFVIGGALALFAAVAATAVVRAQATPFGPSVWDGVYTSAQAQRGAAAFAEHCVECHGADLQGGDGKPLIGDKFWGDWREATVSDLLTFASKNMPFDDGGSKAGSLSANMYADLVAYILSRNEFPAGSKELNAASAVGVQIIRQTGPGELPDGILGRVVGCLEKSGNNFRIVKGSKAQRATIKTLPPPASVPLGEHQYTLKFLMTPLDRYVGYRMVATGLLVGEGGSGGLNVDSVTPVSEKCE
jgi:mono/diheme cytochrome c family protein